MKKKIKVKKKIYKINHQEYQREKNRELELKGDSRRYFYNPLTSIDSILFNCEACEKFQVLYDIKNDTEKTESYQKKYKQEVGDIIIDKYSLNLELNKDRDND